MDLTTISKRNVKGAEIIVACPCCRARLRVDATVGARGRVCDSCYWTIRGTEDLNDPWRLPDMPDGYDSSLAQYQVGIANYSTEVSSDVRERVRENMSSHVSYRPDIAPEWARLIRGILGDIADDTTTRRTDGTAPEFSVRELQAGTVLGTAVSKAVRKVQARDCKDPYWTVQQAIDLITGESARFCADAPERSAFWAIIGSRGCSQEWIRAARKEVERLSAPIQCVRQACARFSEFGVGTPEVPDMGRWEHKVKTLNELISIVSE